METATSTLLIGAGATAATDLWAFARKRAFATPLPNYGLVPLTWGASWLQQPTLAPALVVGIGTVAAPFLLMQPGMGAGIAANRTPRPGAARLQSLITHAVFGLGLYAAALFNASL
jgi:hypothetical protein